MPKKSSRHNRNSRKRGRKSSNRNRRRDARPMTTEEIRVIKEWVRQDERERQAGNGIR